MLYGRCVTTRATGLHLPFYGRCVATSVTGRCVSTRAVAATDAGDEDDANQQDQDESDNPKYLHPAWCAVGEPVSDVRVLLLDSTWVKPWQVLSGSRTATKAYLPQSPCVDALT